jgi:hypothetical protein
LLLLSGCLAVVSPQLGAVLHRLLGDDDQHGAIRAIEAGQQKLRLDGNAVQISTFLTNYS